MAVHRVYDDLFLVDLDQPLEGFRRFISAWVWTKGREAAVVDPGPASTVPVLLQALDRMGIERVPAVLLTHIHLDHAGGTGALLARYPEARVWCHPRAAPHLADPGRLWEGSRNVLGRVAEAYGEPLPVPRDRLVCESSLEIHGIRLEALDTPGHAPHHLCFRAGGILFAGELAGVHLELDGRVYRRPATPPVFRHQVFRRSILRALDAEAQVLCLGHYGTARDPRKALGDALEQLDLWVSTVEEVLAAGAEAWEERALAELARRDAAFALFHRLPDDIRARERFFCRNTLLGIRGFVQGRGGC